MPEYINDEYHIGKTFRKIEEELMSTVICNMKHNRVSDRVEKINWEQWQALQLRLLEKYKKENRKRLKKQFKDINKEIESFIYTANQQGSMDQEKEILEVIKKGYLAKKVSRETKEALSKINDQKLNVLIKTSRIDIEKAENAVLRRVNDQYRKIISDVQVYANTKTGTYETIIDMAAKDMLSAGLNCVEYANGTRHTLSDYVDMAVRTAGKRAYLQGEGQKRQEWGLHLVIMNKRGNSCPKCLPFVGKVFIDDVWSGGSKADGNYPLLSKAISAGLYHPRCKDGHTTYFSGISTLPDDRFSQKELSEIEEQSRLENRKQHAARQEEKYRRMARFSLDSDNQESYRDKAKIWEDKKNWLLRLKDILYYENTDVLQEFKEKVDVISNVDAKILFEQAFKRTRFGKSQRKNSYFDLNNCTIYVSQSATAETIAHELFHEIDKTYGIIDNGALEEQIRNDYKRLMKASEKHGNSIKNMLYSKYSEAFEMGRRGLKLKEEYRGISDILNGMSAGKISLGYRHEESYWKKEKSLERETWAQYGRMIFQDNEKVLEFAEVLFPETTVEVLRILKEMIK